MIETKVRMQNKILSIFLSCVLMFALINDAKTDCFERCKTEATNTLVSCIEAIVGPLVALGVYCFFAPPATALCEGATVPAVVLAAGACVASAVIRWDLCWVDCLINE